MILFETVKNLSPKERFIQIVDGVGEVLEAAVRLRKTALVTRGLEQFKQLFDELQDIRAQDAEKFERLVLSDDVISLAKTDLERARIELGFNPERHAVGLHTLIDQFLRIHKAAIESRHEEISRLSVYQLNYILAKAVTQKGNGLVVEQIINALTEAAQTALHANDRSMYAAAVHWYTDIVFNRLLGDEAKFQIEYLKLFNARCFQLAKLVIREDHNQLFDALTSSLVDGIMPSVSWEEPFWKAVQIDRLPRGDRDFDPGPISRRLSGLVSEGLTAEELPKAEALVDEMAAAIRPHLSGDDLKKFSDTIDELKVRLEDKLKLDELMRLVSAIGAYCVFRGAESQLKDLWEYKQPPDADAEYIGHDIIPTRLDRVFSLFYSGQDLSRAYDFHENHHGSESYYGKYLVLLLARLVDQGNNDQLPSSGDPIYLHRIVDRIDRLKGYVEELALGEKWRLLFLKPKAEVFKSLTALLDSVKASAQSHLDEYVVKSPIAEEKVAEFRLNFREEFDKENVIRKLLIEHGTYKDLSSVQDQDRTIKNKREYNEVADKEPFLPQWYSHYVDWGKQYGKRFALTESEHAVKILLRDLPKYSPTDLGKGPETLEALLSALRHLTQTGYEPSVILTAYDMESMADLRNTPDYLPHWHQDCPKSDIHGYHGCVRFQDKLIPVFWASRLLDGKACVVDLKRVGIWTQLSPVEDPAEELFRQREFIIRIESFGHNEKRLQELLDKNPPWLQTHEDKRQHLLRRALISIRESFQFDISDVKAGVQVSLKADE